jgi:phosphoribosylanthranilate isomerase
MAFMLAFSPVNRTRIKICAVTRPEDAAMAAAGGADAVGMIFHEASARNVTLERGARIVAALPPFVTPVGVFVDAPREKIVETAEKLGMRTVQLNGNEQPEFVAALAGLAVIKAIRVNRGGLEDELRRWRHAIDGGLKLNNLAALVLEPGSTNAPGGTGTPNDWEEIRKAQKIGAFDGLPPIIVAGGLTPQNVADVVRSIRPWAVDVSSGVEEKMGIKSTQKVRDFVSAVRSADKGSDTD